MTVLRSKTFLWAILYLTLQQWIVLARDSLKVNCLQISALTRRSGRSILSFSLLFWRFLLCPFVHSFIIFFLHRRCVLWLLQMQNGPKLSLRGDKRHVTNKQRSRIFLCFLLQLQCGKFLKKKKKKNEQITVIPGHSVKNKGNPTIKDIPCQSYTWNSGCLVIFWMVLLRHIVLISWSSITHSALFAHVYFKSHMLKITFSPDS